MANRADLSQFLIHLTKNGTFQAYGAPVRNGYLPQPQTVVARDSLIEILRNSRVEARAPFGYFKLKINRPLYNNGGVDPNDLKAVCFSEAPLTEINSFYQATTSKRNHYQKYGLGFWQEMVRQKGANPIFYVDSRRADFKASLDTMLGNISAFRSIFPLIETFGPPVLARASGYSDFRWEREWRKHGDLNFDPSDVAFGICPDSEIHQFQQRVNNAFPFVDPDWSHAALKRHLLNFGATQLASEV